MRMEPRLGFAKKSVGAGLKDFEQQIDMKRMRGYRLDRFRAELKRREYAAAVLYDPINIRYATGSRNMAVWTLHNAARYLFVPADGKTVLFDFHGCQHLSDGLETIGEVRPAKSWFFFAAGNRMQEKAKTWAKEMADLFRERLGSAKRIAFDHIDPPGLRALEAEGYEIHDAQEPAEMARVIKSGDEIQCMMHSIAVCEAGMARMRDELKPGMTEQELWASLNDTNNRMGGEWIECRLLASGGRTNPWFKEASEKVIRPGDVVSFDTDLIGPFGYCADLSRSYLCGPSRASEEQKRLYALALEQIHYNIALIKPGLTFKEYSDKAWRIPNAYIANRYSNVAHGVGLCDEYPKVQHSVDYPKSGYDGVFEPNMTVCVESYMGEEGGAEGIKLEQQVLVTDRGSELMTVFPFEERLMG
jgi:Xaa-Pro aminopeptidase